jgi:hypothetical protein
VNFPLVQFQPSWPLFTSCLHCSYPKGLWQGAKTEIRVSLYHSQSPGWARAKSGSAGFWPKYAGSCIYVSKCYILGLVYYFNTHFKPLIPLQ